MLDNIDIKIKKLIKLPQVVVENNQEEFGDKTDIVTLIVLDATGTKQNRSFSKEFTIHPEFNAEGSFVDYASLKPTDVIAWISEEDMAKITDELEQNLNNLLDNESQLPWETL